MTAWLVEDSDDMPTPSEPELNFDVLDPRLPFIGGSHDAAPRTEKPEDP